MIVIDIDLIYMNYEEYINRQNKELGIWESASMAPVSVLALSVVHITKEKRKR